MNLAAMSDDELRRHVEDSAAGPEMWAEVDRRHPVLATLAGAAGMVEAAEMPVGVRVVSGPMPENILDAEAWAAYEASVRVGEQPAPEPSPGLRVLRSMLWTRRHMWVAQDGPFRPGAADRVDRDRVAAIWGISPGSVAKYVKRGIIPAPVGGRWRRGEVLDALRSRRPPGRPRRAPADTGRDPNPSEETQVSRTP
jgi:hypothetical protein